ncbi:MAG: glycosyltransferase family 9 protein [Ignavibacteria bacterium]|nr:glycosyltransferase family 9 protein [Ignavibacteria bacterium]
MKILIVKLAGIGDVVMALSMITEIEKKYPSAKITWIGGKTVEQILKAVEQIDKLIIVDEEALLTGNFFSRVAEIFRIWKKIFANKFDLVITAYRDKRYKIVSLPIIKKEERNLGGKDRNNSIIPGRYHAVEYARLIHQIDDSQLHSVSFPKLKTGYSANVERILSNIPKPRIILAPGGSKNILRDDNLRRWPISYYSKLASKLSENGFSVIIVGAKSDEWLLSEFESKKIYNLVNQTSLIELIKIFDNSDLLVCHDTGVLHLAKLSSIKVIGLFGPVNPRERVGVNENILTIWNGESLSCSPCYDGKNFSKCEDNICMKNISVTQVFEKILELIPLNK